MKSSPAKLAAAKRYYEEHKDERRVYNAVYHAKYRKEAAVYMAAYRLSHQEEIAAHDAARYESHRDEVLADRATYYTKVIKPQIDDRRAFLEKAKSGVMCLDCGSTDVLGFHHRDKTTKKYSVANMLRKPWCDIMDEIFKCDVLCQSCHLKRHRAEDRPLVN